MYIAFPVLLYAGERIFRAIRSGSYEIDVMKVLINFLYHFKIFIKAAACRFKFSVSYDQIFTGLFYRLILCSPLIFHAGKSLSRKSSAPQNAKTRRF
jgi:hypothetical protein